MVHTGNCFQKFAMKGVPLQRLQVRESAIPSLKHHILMGL